MSKEKEFYEKIKHIAQQGNTVEIRKRGDELIVLEVKKKLKEWTVKIG